MNEEGGSPGRTRTSDPAVNSRLLYQLSYRGSGAGRSEPRRAAALDSKTVACFPALCAKATNGSCYRLPCASGGLIPSNGRVQVDLAGFSLQRSALPLGRPQSIAQKYAQQGPHLRPSHSSAAQQTRADRPGHAARWRRPARFSAYSGILDDSAGLPRSIHRFASVPPLEAPNQCLVAPPERGQAKCRWNRGLGGGAPMSFTECVVGGHARNRTGVYGFAVRCVTTPPRGHRAGLSSVVSARVQQLFGLEYSRTD